MSNDRRRFRHWLSRAAVPRRRRRAVRAEAAIERLEDRTLLSAGDLLWSRLPDFAATEDDTFNDVAVQSDGKIVAVGTYHFSADDGDFLIARFTAGGRLDKSFGGGDGWVVQSFGSDMDEQANAVVIQPDGKILIAGTVTPSASGSQAALMRLTQDGNLDRSFGGAGGGPGMISFLNLNGTNLWFNALSLASGGRFVAAGGTNVTGSTSGTVSLFNADGTPDKTFNNGQGRLLSSGEVTDVAVDAQGRIVTAGRTGTVTRLTSAGPLDGTFKGPVSVYFDVGGTPATLYGIAIDAAGRIVVGGHSYDGTDYRPGAARLLSDGSYDVSFDDDGSVSFDPTANVSDYVRDVAVLPNGGVVLAGEDARAGGDWFVAVLTSKGLLDAGFRGDGMQYYGMGGSDSVGGLAVTRDGHYVVAGRVFTSAADGAPGIAAVEGRYPRRDDLLGWAGGAWHVLASTGGSFEARSFGDSWSPDAGWQVLDTADFNGDGFADVAGRDSAGQWWVALNSRRGWLGAAKVWGRWQEGALWRDVRFGDFNGDGKADVAGRTYYGEWWVSLSTGAGLRGATYWETWSAKADWKDVIAADFTGDGKADIAGRASNGEWWVNVSTGARFARAKWDTWSEAAKWRDVRVGDFNGDGRQDLAGRTYYGEWWVGVSTGGAFSKSRWAAWSEADGWKDVLVGDFDGDGKADIAARNRYGEWRVASSDLAGTAFVDPPRKWDTWNEAAKWRDVRVGDFDGDGKSDIAGCTYYGEWWVSRTVGGQVFQSRWGSWGVAAVSRTFVQDEFFPTV